MYHCVRENDESVPDEWKIHHHLSFLLVNFFLRIFFFAGNLFYCVKRFTLTSTEYFGMVPPSIPPPQPATQKRNKP
jgi:hypothetical protein